MIQLCLSFYACHICFIVLYMFYCSFRLLLRDKLLQIDIMAGESVQIPTMACGGFIPLYRNQESYGTGRMVK